MGVVAKSAQNPIQNHTVELQEDIMDGLTHETQGRTSQQYPYSPKDGL